MELQFCGKKVFSLSFKWINVPWEVSVLMLGKGEKVAGASGNLLADLSM